MFSRDFGNQVNTELEDLAVELGSKLGGSIGGNTGMYKVELSFKDAIRFFLLKMLEEEGNEFPGRNFCILHHFEETSPN